MSTRNRTPPLLEPYLRLPSPGTQLLLTGVLDSTPNWLVTRLLRSAFTASTETETPEEKDVTVVLVSWLRDYEFWKNEARRGAGIDLARLAQQDRFVFVDGLTHLFPVNATEKAATATPQPAPRSLPVRSTPASPLPSRGGPLPSRGPIPSRGPAAPTPAPSQVQPTAQQTQPQAQQPNSHQPIYLKDASTSSTHTHLTTLLSSLQSSHPNRKIHLILDSPTLLLSTTSSPSASALSSLLLSLRSLATTSTLITQADSPFLSAALPDVSHHSTPLEAAHAAFVVQQAHLSKWVLSLRPLDTGKARDVSGVIRVCRGGAWDEDEEEEVEKEQSKELEALYFVQNDGGVKVFERGEASVG